MSVIFNPFLLGHNCHVHPPVAFVAAVVVRRRFDQHEEVEEEFLLRLLRLLSPRLWNILCKFLYIPSPIFFSTLLYFTFPLFLSFLLSFGISNHPW